MFTYVEYFKKFFYRLVKLVCHFFVVGVKIEPGREMKRCYQHQSKGTVKQQMAEAFSRN